MSSSSSNGVEKLAFANGTITRVDLKRFTGEFDLESIFQLDASGQSLNDIGCLPECSCIEFLDLSHNSIKDVSQLSSLKKLRFLNLAGNQLAGLIDLSGCDCLEILNLAGNLISSSEHLQPLENLKSLRSLHLQDKQSCHNNPICLSESYVAIVTDLLPSITDLDGDKIRGTADSYLELCRKLDSALNFNSKKQQQQQQQTGSAKGRSGLDESYWSIPVANQQLAEAEEAEKEFAAAVARVRDLELQALLRIEQCERDLNKKLKF